MVFWNFSGIVRTMRAISVYAELEKNFDKYLEHEWNGANLEKFIVEFF